MRVDLISLNESYDEKGIKATPLFTQLDQGNQLVAHRVIEGPSKGAILTTGQYVVLGSLTKRECDEDSLILEVGALVEEWVNAGYRGRAKKDDIIKFSKDLINYFKSKL